MAPARRRGAWPRACPRPHFVRDSFDYVLTWSAVLYGHNVLVYHAPCAAAAAAYEAAVAASDGAFDSDDEDAPPRPCPCQYHDGMTDELWAHRRACESWPGPICGSCWASQCLVCDYVLDDPRDAASRSSSMRLVCHACMPDNLYDNDSAWRDGDRDLEG